MENSGQGELGGDGIGEASIETKRNRMHSVMEIIAELEKHSKPVAISQVVVEADKFGINEVQCRELISKLQRDGDLYEPRPGMIRRAF